jgi:hypothetical protein
MAKRPKAQRTPSADLVLSTLQASSMPGLTRHRGGSLAQACSVCLDEEGHATIFSLTVAGDISDELRVRRLPVTDQMKRTFAFETRVTEEAACCLAILLLFRHTGRSVLWESKRTTGFDYFLGTDPGFPFRDGVRLEVSGIRRGSDADIVKRIREKIDQITPSNNLATGYVVVVEFSSPEARVLGICQTQEN